ncbi:hypothetical protein PENVUL_c092G07715 [Penicillium vulpinum]|uniref:Myb-like domain-containing protein n=1 Tax=Penicillium vulpinum TaxID=29845 RepID=A0A1V6R4Z2_9EURO|nr:hypothetical protein PENVUL_c092G07715 [Penicillium vulpinum]
MTALILSISKQWRISLVSQHIWTNVLRIALASRIKTRLSSAEDTKKETVDHDSQSSKVQKFPPIGKRKANNCSSRSIRGPGRGKNGSFPAIRAQFSALSVEDRLQFLSWLFKSAISHHISTRANTDAASVSRSIPSQDVSISCDYPSSNTELVDVQPTPTRKGLPWSVEESHLLVKLREEQNLAWSEMTKLFAQKFPGRSKGSIQVYWSTTLKKQR